VSPTSTLVPPHRLGALLSEQRARDGSTVDDIVTRLGGRISSDLLRDVEAGRRAVLDEDLLQLVPAYGISAQELVPARSELVIDLDAGTIAAGGRSGAIVEGRSTEILAQYLALVYELRDVRSGTPLALRDLDLDVLGEALRLERSAVGQRLDAMMNDAVTVATRRRGLRHRLIVPAAGILVGATTVGALVLLTQDDAPPAPGAAVAEATADVPAPEAPVLIPPAELER
jgi:hypothetical protein